MKMLAAIWLAFVATQSRGLPSNAPCPTSDLTANMLLEIAPTSGTCSATNAFPQECRTNYEALCPIARSFSKYGITHPSVQAALISLVAYESGEFKFNTNHYPAPGNPGQGTRNMQSPAFNERYGLTLGKTYDQILASDDDSFASAAYFITSQCDLSIREAMWTGSLVAYEDYLQSCVGTQANPERIEYWERAMRALGLTPTS